MDKEESLVGPVDGTIQKEVLSIGHPVLRERASPVAVGNILSEEVQSLVRDMVDVMRDGQGIGLAAPQIGVPERVIVVEIGERTAAGFVDCTPLEIQAIFNPEVTVLDSRPITGLERCLSVPGYQGVVERPYAVKVAGYDERGAPQNWEFTGWNARLILHEYDHLNGTLYVDKIVRRGGALQLFHGDEIRKVLASLREQRDEALLAYYGRRLVDPS